MLLLVDTVAATQGHSGKVDGLTKLAKLDFLLRYPALAPAVLDGLDPADRPPAPVRRRQSRAS